MLSVVLPVYNGEQFLSEAVESILNQTYREFELIVVDDGSTDRSLEIVHEYARKDDRVRVIHNEHDGISSALNTGIRAAKYDWIARMDADDVSLPERFAKQVAAIKANPDVVVWGTYIHHINSAGDILSLSKVGPSTRREFIERRSGGQLVQVIHPTAIMRKDIVLKSGGYKHNFPATQDAELFDRMGDYGPILVVPEALVLYRVHPYSTSMTRFFLQKKLARYVNARRRKENTGQGTLDFDEFMQAYDNVSLPDRMKRYLTDLRVFYYRRAGMLYGNKKMLPAMFYFGISTLLNPRYALTRAWRQVLSPAARRGRRHDVRETQETPEVQVIG